MYDLEEVRGKAKLKHVELSRKLHSKAMTYIERVGADRDGALSRYHGVLRSFRWIVMAADERNAGHVDKLTQLRVLFE